MPSDDPGCLPPAGTLHRIRWPLQPRSRDRLTAFGDGATAGWRSLATLSLVPILTRQPSEFDDSRVLSRCGLPTVSPADRFAPLGPCSLDPARSFWSAFAELIRDLTSPTDFCNIQRRASNQTRALDPRRDGGLDLLPFLTCRAASLAGATTRGEPRSVRSR